MPLTDLILNKNAFVMSYNSEEILGYPHFMIDAG